MSEHHTEDPAAHRAPAGIDVSVASVARVYDYLLGGKDNFKVDREAADAMLAIDPSSRAMTVNNRRFLQRAVRFLAREHAITQFVDHGSGLPTQDNVHQIAQSVDPGARVVYIDNDPIVLAHGRALLAENASTTVITADVRDTDAVMTHPEVVKLIDFDRPVGALFVSLLHSIPDRDDPGALLRRVVDRLAPGSFVVLSHLVSLDDMIRKQRSAFALAAHGGNWGRVRTPEEVAAFVEEAGLEPLEPGLVEVSRWRPDGTDGPVQDSTEWFEFGGVARKR
ncbi:SAM-dependent methyltransferase [Yinghuangia sp. ASG 101]|uniref:SAM-dependent methyltransferase n=1 Tax=Yinghuangia sp. ASG 101 TaxID=2896848 RepID=UPI001E627B1B|nr:SAM-dependent methyltransferase [Yinghuangia sp. ASG 101]UGQ13092.1 SAM-dependent methyltransferase [Yinghuangia sp. ASG 101]